MTDKLPIDPELRRFLDEQPSAGPVHSTWDARRRLEKQLDARESIPGLPNDVHSAEYYAWTGDEKGLRVRVYTPHGHAGAQLPVLVYLHGGGWVAGSIETHDPFCRLLAKLAAVSIVSVDYRRAPESPHPAALEDARTAFRWAAEHAASWGGDADRLALGGDSSGGHLAAAAANRLAIEVGAPALRALLLLYPVTDHPCAEHASYAENGIGYGLEADSMRWYWEQYAKDASPEDSEVSPLRAPVLPRLPPTLVMTAQYDVLRDEGVAYARKLESAGVEVTHVHSPDMHHNFAVGPGTVGRFPQSAGALGEIAAFLRAHLR